jgi:hypothetical protein
MQYSGLLIGLFLTAGVARAADSPVRNYEECVKAGYPTGTAAFQERCWTPWDFRTFVKGLKPTIRQGIYGTITLRTGDCMPLSVKEGKDGRLIVPPRKNPCTVTVVDRDVYIFPVLRSHYKWGSYLPTDIAPLRTVTSKNGFFEVELPPGSYSVLVESRGRKYCRWSNANHEACPATIKMGELWEHQIVINQATD